MMQDQFVQAVKRAVAPGHTFDNPGGGTSRITKVDNNGISYVRGNSTIYVSFGDLYSVYDRFKGGRVSSTDCGSSHPRSSILRRGRLGTHAIAPSFSSCCRR